MEQKKMNERRRFEWMNPFFSLTGERALAIGVIGMILIGVIGYFSGMVNDGVFDLHIYPSDWKIALLYPLGSWFVLSVCLGVGLMVIRRGAFRWIDIFGFTAFARLPLLLGVLTGFLIPHTAPEMSHMILPGIISVIAVVWSIIYTWSGFRLCAGKGGWKTVITFILAIIAAYLIVIGLTLSQRRALLEKYTNKM